MRAAYRVRLVANLVNGSTLAGVLVAAAGRARLAQGEDGLLIGEGYRLPVPPAPAFTLGNVILTKAGRPAGLGEDHIPERERRGGRHRQPVPLPDQQAILSLGQPGPPGGGHQDAGQGRPVHQVGDQPHPVGGPHPPVSARAGPARG